jgi:DNA polymerase-3 subunit beta
MKFTANNADLQRTLNKIGAVIPTRSTLPILENILFDLLNNTLTLTATDLEVSLTVSTQVKGSEDGKIAIPAKRLLDTIRALPENTTPNFSIDTTTNKIRITTENGEYALTGESAKEFPAVPPFKSTGEIAIDNATLRRMIHRTAFAVSTDELRPAMMGVLIQTKGNDLCAVATDGHRLVKHIHKAEKAGSLKRDIIVPAKALQLVNKSIESGNNTISINDTHIRFAFDNTILISRLIDESYPNYESVIPTDNKKELIVNRSSLADSIRRVALYASATTHQVRFDVKKGSLSVTAQDIDFGGEAKETVECKYNDDELEIGFNSTYVVDVLAHLDSEEISFKFSSPTRAGIVMPVNPKEGEEVLMLVMPVRLST